jgi:hypothetical protein
MCGVQPVWWRIGRLARLLVGLHDSDPAQHRARDPTTHEKQIEVQQSLEIRRVFKAASLMIAELDAACLNLLNVRECSVNRNGRDNQGDPKADFLIHRALTSIG